MALVLLVSLFVATTTAVDFGNSANVYAAKWTELTYTNGLNLALPYKLYVYCDVNTTITFDAYFNATLWATFNASGYKELKLGSALGVGGSAGYEITYSNTDANCAVNITFPALDVTLLAQLVLGVDVGVLKLDAQTGVAQRISNVAFSNNVVTVSLPTAKGRQVYLTAAIYETWAVSTELGKAAATWAAAWANQTYVWSCQNLQDLLIEINSSVSTQVTVTPLTNSSYSVSADLKALNVWFKIDLSVEAKHESTIQYKYTDAQLTAAFGAGADASRLRLAYYDTAKAVWVFPENGYSVNTNTKVVAQVTSHFSEWGVYYSGSKNFASTLQIQSFTLVGLILLALTLSL